MDWLILGALALAALLGGLVLFGGFFLDLLLSGAIFDATRRRK